VYALRASRSSSSRPAKNKIKTSDGEAKRRSGSEIQNQETNQKEEQNRDRRKTGLFVVMCLE